MTASKLNPAIISHWLHASSKRYPPLVSLGYADIISNKKGDSYESINMRSGLIDNTSRLPTYSGVVLL